MPGTVHLLEHSDGYLQIRRNLRSRPRPAIMRAYLRRLTQHRASFVVVERSRKAKIRPLELPAFWLQTRGRQVYTGRLWLFRT